MWFIAHLAARPLGATVAGGAAVLLLPAALAAQPPAGGSAAPLPASSRPCSMAARALTVRLVDAATGAAIREGDATVRVTRLLNGTRLRDANELPVVPGRWVVLTSASVPDLSRVGEVLQLEIARPGRPPVRHELRVSLDAAGCHPVSSDSLVEVKG